MDFATREASKNLSLLWILLRRSAIPHSLGKPSKRFAQSQSRSVSLTAKLRGIPASIY